MAIDWPQLNGGAELDRLVAERYGFVIRQGARGWEVTPPEYSPWYPESKTVRTADEVDLVIPAFSTSVDAALTLLPDPITTGIRFFLNHYYVPSQLYWECVLRKQETGSASTTLYVRRLAEAPALAIVRAWLAWKDTADD